MGKDKMKKLPTGFVVDEKLPEGFVVDQPQKGEKGEHPLETAIKSFLEAKNMIGNMPGKIKKGEIKPAIEDAMRIVARVQSPLGRGGQEIITGGQKGATLGYLNPTENESLSTKTGELAGSFLPYMAAGGVVGAASKIPKIAQIMSKAPALARIGQTALTTGAVGAARPAKDLGERAKRGGVEALVGGAVQTGIEGAIKAAPVVKQGTTWILSKTTGIPEDKMKQAVYQTADVFKQKGTKVWDDLAQRLKKGHEILQQKAGMEVQDAIANSPKLSKVAYDYQATKDNILTKVAEKQKQWLGADRMNAGEKETLNKLYTMLESPEGRFGNQLSFSKLHQAKKLLDDNLTFAQSNRLNPAPTEGEKLLKNIRNSINTELGRDAKNVPEVADYVNANKFYGIYKEKLAPIKSIIEDRSMALPQKLKSLENKSEDLQKALKEFDRLLPKKYSIRKGLELAQTAKAFEPLTRKGAGLPTLLGAGGLGATGYYNPALAATLGLAGATTSPATVGLGLRGGAALTRGLKKLPEILKYAPLALKK